MCNLSTNRAALIHSISFNCCDLKCQSEDKRCPNRREVECDSKEAFKYSSSLNLCCYDKIR